MTPESVAALEQWARNRGARGLDLAMMEAVDALCAAWREGQQQLHEADERAAGDDVTFKRLIEERTAADNQRDAALQRAEQAEVTVALLRDFTTRERALRDAVGKGGQHVGYGPSINPTTLRELERMITDAPSTANWLGEQVRKAEASLAQAQAEAAQVRATLVAVEWCGKDTCIHGVCPYCGRMVTRGHAADCRIQAALTNGTQGRMGQ